MNRASLYNAIPHILSGIKAYHQPGTSGDMFNSKESKMDLALDVPSISDWSLNTRLWLERKALGTWVSGHPLQLVAGKYEHKIKFKLRDVPELLNAPTTQTYNFAFIVRRVFVVKSVVMIVEGEDESGTAEFNLYVSDADRWLHALKEDAILIAQCLPRHNGKFSAMQIQKVHKLGALRAPTPDEIKDPA